MKKGIKILLTTILISLVILPVGYFLIYPNYNKLIGPIKRFDIHRSAHEITFQVLTALVPSKDSILGTEDISEKYLSIEESIGKDFILEEKVIEQRNTVLTISSIEVEGKIYEGIESTTMDKGFWHFPTSQLPGQKGNVVVMGHRYANLPPKKDTFFNLDKVKVGDRIEIIEQDRQYTYIVTETKVVEKNDVSILSDFSDYRITLVTCTPLWTDNQRLVIVGKLDKLYQNT
jgi:sortase A